MKKWVALLLTSVMLLSVVAAVADGKNLAAVQADGVLVVGTSPDFPPYEMLDMNLESGNLEVVGIEMDILAIVAEKLGVTLDIRPVDFDSILPGLKAGSYDMGVSGFTVTEERKQNVVFTSIYSVTSISIVVLEGSTITGVDDLAGKKLSLQSGTTAEALCLESEYDFSAFKQNVDALMSLTNGSVDAWVIDKATAVNMVKEYNSENPDKPQLVILEAPLSEEPYAFALDFGSEDLAEAISAILDEMVADGTMEEIFAKYEVDYLAPEKAE